jgi:hypothetical protein
VPPSSSPSDEIERQRVRLQAAVGASVEVRGLIGSGGFADIFAAWDVKLRRELAIKVLRADLAAAPDVLNRFESEALAIAALRHPNIVPIYTVGGEDGLAFFTMPRVSGETLAAVLEREGRLDVGDACRILREAASALAEAHRHGIVHRDVKPENIMLEGADRRVLLMDFGIAKTTLADASGLTITGMVVGTPQYMSPEQAAGERVIDGRSDQYSLGMVGYRMLAGALPFETQSAQQLMFRQLTETPPSLTTVSPDVPATVSTAIARALSKNPQERFASMDAFADAVAPAAGAVVRRQDSVATRVTSLQKDRVGWVHPLVFAGIVGAVVTMALRPTVSTPPAWEIAVERDAAAITAKRVAESFGARSPLKWRSNTFRRSTSLYAFLQSAVGRDSANARARGDMPVWYWQFEGADGRDDEWRVHVSHRGRTTLFERSLHDSISLPDRGSDSSRRLAMGRLRELGWTMDRMRPRPDSTVANGRRIERVFAWEDVAARIAHGQDTARAVIRARVAGDNVLGFQYAMDLPRIESRGVLARLRPIAWGIALLALMAGAIAAITLAIVRQRVDIFDWKLAVRIMGLLWVVVLGPGLLQASDVLEATFFVVVGAGGMIVALAVADSLAAEHHPRLFAGLSDLARGRVPPELGIAVLLGIPIGLIVSAATTLASSFAIHVLRTPVPPDDLPRFATSAFGSLTSEMAGIAIAVLGIATLSIMGRHARIPGSKVVLPVLWAGLAVFPSTSVEIPDALGLGLATLIGAMTAWRYGVLTTIIAAWVALAVHEVSALITYGGQSEANGALASSVLFVAPLIAGAVAFRRFFSARAL